MGEYAAAVLAGTMSLETGLKLVARRAELIDQKCDIGPRGRSETFGGKAG